MPSISFFYPAQDPIILPPSIHREIVPSQYGPLEVLVGSPANSSLPRKRAFFFAHGGCSGAATWLEWMDYFSQQHNIPCYAVSYRGHGSSWYPSYLRMLFTTKRSMADDLITGIKAAMALEKEVTGVEQEMILVGHSSGGGLTQFILSEGDIKVAGLALVGAIPCFGNREVNNNWLRFDPWFMVRMLFKHFGHPMSPLSSTKLVKQAFFCNQYPMEKVVEFEKRMPRMESLLWPLSMTNRLASCANVIKNIVSRGNSLRIAVIAGEFDRLVDPTLVRRTGNEYRMAFASAVGSGDLKAEYDEVEELENEESVGLGVRGYLVKGAGHHIQNDLQWEDGALKLLDFYSQL